MLQLLTIASIKKSLIIASVNPSAGRPTGRVVNNMTSVCEDPGSNPLKDVCFLYESLVGPWS